MIGYLFFAFAQGIVIDTTRQIEKPDC